MLTQEDLERRRKFVTATDIPRILGMSPWGNAADVFVEKVYGTEQSGNAATETGLMLEPFVLQWAETQLGTLIGGGFESKGLLSATLDQKTSLGEPVEAKTSGIVSPGSPYQWGNDYTDEIPDYYLVQVQVQLFVTGAARAFVPALIGGKGFSMYVVSENKELQAFIEAKATEFWEYHVAPQVAPPDVRPKLDTLKRVLRVPGKSVEVDDELARRFIEAKDAAKDAAIAEDQAKAALLAAIGDAEIAKSNVGEFTYREQVRKGYTVKESTSRVLRFKKEKALA